jgi:murein DD-endopeptidase MepM/ murein hydrolase activator NlpD
MYLNLKTDRPARLMLCMALAVFGACVWSLRSPVPAVGGSDAPETSVRSLEARLLDLREEQIVRARREEILRSQLAAFDEADLSPDMRDARDALLELLLDRRHAEDEIGASIRELWDAQGYAQRASRRPHGSARVTFDWPVEPALGISAHFDDPAYRARFGFPHKAIDIPVNQGSTVRSAADGVVEKISDQGMGFSSIVIRHAGGYATMYGHVSAFLVAEGDEVAMGDAVAESGGMPGTKGAGRMTTGPHLHFELFKDGVHVDPLPYLPDADTVR